MILIVDANVVISALIRDGKSRELLIYSPFTFYSPDSLLESIEKYKDEFVKKSGLTLEEFEVVLNFILKRIIIVKKEEYESQLMRANEIMGHIDVEDVAYVALALFIEGSVIWSDDAHFQEQDEIEVYRTEDVVRRIEGGF
tara:strand:+ start:1050 stop:1472 length:423 start_codon:yes stop_codon:yes gene_type:complete